MESKKRAIVNQGVDVIVQVLGQLEVYPLFFSDRIEEVSPNMSISFFNLLLYHEYISKNEQNKYFMVKNPRKEPMLKNLHVTGELMEPMREELQLLQGYHELSSQYCDEWLNDMLSFCN